MTCDFCSQDEIDTCQYCGRLFCEEHGTDNACTECRDEFDESKLDDIEDAENADFTKT